MTTVKDIIGDSIKQWLFNNGYDGLACPDLDCGCDLSDFQPCDEMQMDCEPAYKREIDDSDCDFEMYIGPKENGKKENKKSEE